MRARRYAPRRDAHAPAAAADRLSSAAGRPRSFEVRDARLKPQDAMLGAIDPAVGLGVPPHRALGNGRDSFGDQPDVAPERLDDDIEVPARPFLGLDDPRLESVPCLDEAGINVTPDSGDLSCDVLAKIALQPLEGVTCLGVHGATFAARSPGVNVADRMLCAGPERADHCGGRRRTP